MQKKEERTVQGKKGEAKPKKLSTTFKEKLHNLSTTTKKVMADIAKADKEMTAQIRKIEESASNY